MTRPKGYEAVTGDGGCGGWAVEWGALDDVDLEEATSTQISRHITINWGRKHENTQQSAGGGVLSRKDMVSQINDIHYLMVTTV